MKTSHFLRTWTLSLGAIDLRYLDLAAPASTPALTAPVWLDVEFDYQPAIRAPLTLRNGDPGDEPPAPADLTLLRISASGPLQFADAAAGVLVTLPGARDLRRFFTDDALTQIELDLFQQLRAARDESKLDAYLGSL